MHACAKNSAEQHTQKDWEGKRGKMGTDAREKPEKGRKIKEREETLVLPRSGMHTGAGCPILIKCFVETL